MILDSIVRGNIRTMDTVRPRATKMGVWNGLIVGFDEELSGLDTKRTIDYGPYSIYPGFIDGHTHLGVSGMQLIAADLSGVRDLEEFKTEIKNISVRDQSAKVVEVWGYDQRKFGRHITVAELDELDIPRPVVVRHISSHAMVVNSKLIQRIPDSGLRKTILQQDGLVVEHEQDWVRQIMEPYSVRKVQGAIISAVNNVIQDGITTCIEAGIGAGLCSYTKLDGRVFYDLGSKLKVRVQLMVSIDALHPVEAHEADCATLGLDLGLGAPFGNDRVWLGPAKIWLDGGMMARTAAFTKPYGMDCTVGSLSGEPERLEEKMIDAHKSGWDVAAHAIGDKAIDVALNAFERAGKELPSDNRRHRIEHGGYIRDDQLKRLRKLDISIGTQPCFITLMGEDFSKLIGPSRSDGLYRGRSLIDNGVNLVGSTDRPLAGTPLMGIKTMLDRKTAKGLIIGKREAISRVEALKAYTVNAAWAARKEDRMGSLSIGKVADYTVMNEDILEINLGEWERLKIIATHVAGEVVYRNDDI